MAKLDGRDGNLYFATGVYDRLRASPHLLDEVVRAIASAPGVGHVFRSEELKGARGDSDPWRRAAALSYVEGRSGGSSVLFDGRYESSSRSCATHARSSGDVR